MADKFDPKSNLASVFGQIKTEAPTDAKKMPLMSFSKNNIFLGIKLVATYDEKTGTHRDPIPRLTASFNGHFVEMPVDGEFWAEYAKFCSKMAELLEGVHIENAVIKDDVEVAKGLMGAFKTR